MTLTMLRNVHAVHINEFGRFPAGELPQSAEALQVALQRSKRHRKNGDREILDIERGAGRAKGSAADIWLDDILQRAILHISPDIQMGIALAEKFCGSRTQFDRGEEDDELFTRDVIAQILRPDNTVDQIQVVVKVTVQTR